VTSYYLIFREVLSKIVLLPLTEQEWAKSASDYQERWNFPNAVGSIDGKHCVIQSPPNTGSLYHNYKGTFSIVLLAVADANYCFSYVHTGCPGSEGDAGIFLRSDLGKFMNDNVINFPKPKTLPGSNIETPHFLLGDEAFGQKPNMMRPYSGKALGRKQRIFNYRLSRARRVIENTFGIYAARWRVFHGKIHASPETARGIIRATVALHNFLQKKNCKKYCPSNYPDQEDLSTGDLRPGQWRREIDNNCAIRSAGRHGSNNSSFEAQAIRNNLADYFLGPGAVEWQERLTFGEFVPSDSD